MVIKTAADRELKVVLDTSALYTHMASDLVKNEVRDLINQNLHHKDLKTSWHLPEVVMHERQYQMIQKANDHLISLEKIERLLGHKLGITHETLKGLVEVAVSRQMLELKIHKLSLDHTKVDWSQLITNAAYRIAPFEHGDKEKGFRDSLVLESFMQLIAGSPKTPSKCRIALVTNDTKLSDAANSRIQGMHNSTVLNNLDDLRALINTLASEVSEEYIQQMQIKAANIFFVDKDNKEALYYKEKISDRISEDFSEQLKEVPVADGIRKRSGISIVRPRFVKKDKQRIYWTSRINFKAEIFLNTPKAKIQQQFTGGLLGLSSMVPPSPSTSALSSLLSSYVASQGIKQQVELPQEQKLIRTGISKFEVNWSVSISSAQKLIKPIVDSIIFTESEWDEDFPGL